MINNTISLPSSRQTVRIIVDDEESEIYAVVDVVTLDGRIKMFCLEDLTTWSITPNSCILLEYGYDDALYRSSWRVDFIEHGHLHGVDEKPSLLLLSPDYETQRIQRREYFRLTIKLPVRYKNVVFPREFVANFQLRREMNQIWNIEKKSFPHFGETIDISEGGICFYTKSSLKMGDEIVLELQLPDDSIITAAVVKWSSFIEIEDQVFQKAGIQFVCDRLQEKKKIRNFISLEQRRKLQAEKIKRVISKSS